MPPHTPPTTIIRITRRAAFTALAFITFLLLLFSLAISFLATSLNEPPESFPLFTDIEVTEGLAQNDITEMLEEQNVVKSSLYLYLYLRQRYPDEFIKAGSYQFTELMSTRDVADALVTGTHRTPHLRFTLPEGFRIDDLAALLPEKLGVTSTASFSEYEGFLFPDTYFVSQEATLDEIITLLRDTYEEKISPLRPAIEVSGFTEEEVINLASLIEREAKDAESKRIVSGILQNRLELGMPLQVDATFDYLLGKTSAELTEDDLDIDSPYNTYRYTGLPPTPISNPGLESIEAVLEPTPSEYLYYLTGDDGRFYYARTFEEHKTNKQQFLR
jgi:UPF0755 protein